jgi:hypothetical protein
MLFGFFLRISGDIIVGGSRVGVRGGAGIARLDDESLLGALKRYAHVAHGLTVHICACNGPNWQKKAKGQTPLEN